MAERMLHYFGDSDNYERSENSEFSEEPDNLKTNIYE